MLSLLILGILLISCVSKVPSEQAPIREDFSSEDYMCGSDKDCKRQFVKGCSYISVNKKAFIDVDDTCFTGQGEEPFCVDNKCVIKNFKGYIQK